MRRTEIFTREGILSVAVPADIAAAIAALYEDAAHEAVLETAALFWVRMGDERGAAQLRAWLADDPGYLGWIPREVRRRLAFEPEAFPGKDAAGDRRATESVSRMSVRRAMEGEIEDARPGKLAFRPL